MSATHAMCEYPSLCDHPQRSTFVSDLCDYTPVCDKNWPILKWMYSCLQHKTNADFLMDAYHDIYVYTKIKLPIF